MPKKSNKEEIKKEEIKKILTKDNKQEPKTKNDSTVKKNIVTKKATNKKVDLDKVAPKKINDKKTTSTAKKAVSTKKETTSKKVALDKVAPKKVNDKKTTSTIKKTAPTKRKTVSSVKKVTSSKVKTASKVKPKIEVLEYYDLPYRYNQTVVKVLYQTPNILFIYWDISDDDRKKFINQFGENFFNDTIPVLIVHNNTLHYTFEIEIDDFANNWYLHINDTNCSYSIELGRKARPDRNIDIPNNYIHVTYSNQIESPNDHVLFDKNLKFVYFKDVKTNVITKTAITSLSFMRMMGKIYSLYDLQTNFGKDSWLNNNKWQLDLNNPSSANPSSKMN